MHSCTSRCITKTSPPFSASIREKDRNIPIEVVNSMLRSPSLRRSDFGIPCRSRTAIKASSSAARGFRVRTRSYDNSMSGQQSLEHSWVVLDQTDPHLEVQSAQTRWLEASLGNL